MVVASDVVLCCWRVVELEVVIVNTSILMVRGIIVVCGKRINFFVFNLFGLSKICSQRQILEQMMDAVWRRREKKKHEEGDAP